MIYKDKVVVQSYVPVEVDVKLRKLAREDDVSLSKYIARILKSHVIACSKEEATDAVQGADGRSKE